MAGRRTRVSLAGAFLVAAALVGGPLVGACAGASTEAFPAREGRRRRVTCAVAGALQGLVIGLVGEQFPHRNLSGAVVAATVGLVAGFALNLRIVLRALGRRLRAELRAARRAIVVGWFLPAPLLVVFLYLDETRPSLALVLAAALLLTAAWANLFRRRLERTLAGERSRARVDALTSAPNRYALTEALAYEQARIGRGGRTAALCFLDLDRFKTVNDTYGYAAGDRLLVDVHQRLRSELRASDLVFRWGGEEFVVLAPHVDRAELADFAERLRLLLATRPFAIDGRPRTVTGSVGAVLLDGSRPAQAALEAAGRLVREAKRTRNTAVVERAAAGAAA
ncbi:MAG TPA: GGDEF domain-containing protein [Gaiellaceae bacterium]|nr:GGDEF domain-containing protein [Gaiellaceae bacterium]